MGTERRWGNINNFDLSFMYGFKAILNINLLFFRLQKILNFTKHIAFNYGICLTFVPVYLRRRFLCEFNRKTFLKNFYIIFIKGLFGFISNFRYFILNHRRFLLENKYTNYIAYRLPSLIFLPKGVWRDAKGFFRTFWKLRIMFIKSCRYLDTYDNNGYLLWIGKCRTFFKVIRYIFFMINIYKKLW
jgi:hypothetical protein